MRNTRLLDRFFDIGVAIKGIDGFLETVGGMLLLFVTKTELNGFIIALTQHELSEDPGDLIANWMRRTVFHLSSNTQVFAAAYLLAHGAVKIFLAAQLLRRKLWSYPVAVAFLCAFTGYQLYRLFVRYSWGLLFLTCFDVVIIVVIWREYRLLREG